MKLRSFLNSQFLHRLGYSLEWYNRRQIVPNDLPEPALYGGPEDPSLFFHPWNGGDFVRRLSPAIRENTMLSRQKLYLLLKSFVGSLNLEGDIMEAGTCSGGSALLLAHETDRLGIKKRFWLLDTFEGHQQVDANRDGIHIQIAACRGKSQSEVANLFSTSQQDVRLIKGLIPATLKDVETTSLCFAHIDVNLYEPTYESTRFALERLCRGGIIVFDDYNWPATFGARKAIDEACREFNREPISLPETTQAILIG